MPSPTEITPQQLNRLIGTHTCPPIIDVCIDADFALDPYLIPTARKHPFKDALDLVSNLTSTNPIIVCQKGLKLSHGVAALLRTQGIDAQVLAGGMVAWRAAELPSVPHSSVPWQSNGTTLWVTRHRPKIDRIACPWLIRRFIDPCARFLFVPPETVLDVAEKFNAAAFDVEGANFTHRGDQCTFDDMLDQFELRTPALDNLSKIIRGADTNNLDLTPQSTGLSAAALGLSRIYRDDLEQLEAGMILFDSFYRWARDAQSETHDWPK